MLRTSHQGARYGHTRAGIEEPGTGFGASEGNLSDQVEMLNCQKETCARNVSKEENLGDFMRIQAETREEIHGLRKEIRDFCHAGA